MKQRFGFIYLITLFAPFFLFALPFKVYALTIDNLQPDGSSVSLYEKWELRFSLSDTVAENFDFPYDGQVIAGLPNRIGVTVDGLFLPPGETDWDQALVQPAFFYQPVVKDTDLGWFYPQGKPYWLIRFAPKQTGQWRYKVRAQDDSLCRGADPCDQWVESGEGVFDVGPAQPGNHGFVEVSPNDSRYFQMSDGSDFFGLGFQTDLNGGRVEPYLEEMREDGVGLVRTWMSASLIVGRGTHGWDPWRWQGRGYTKIGPADGVSGVPYGNSDFSVRLQGNGDNIYLYSGGTYQNSGVEAGKTYRVRARVRLDNVVADPNAAEPKGLVIKMLGDAYQFTNPSATLFNITPVGDTGTQDWHLFEGSFTSSQRRRFSWSYALAIGLLNVTSGTAYLDEISVQEDLGGSSFGPNILFKNKFNYHLYFDPIAAAKWDDVLERAEAKGVYIKPVVLEKEDYYFMHIGLDDGIFSQSNTGTDNFYSEPGKKVRRLHEYFWRYLAARWGYSTAVHSWELVNEADPYNRRHYNQTNAFVEVINRWDRNHLATTSFWTSLPVSFWQSSPAGYADLHAYVSTSYLDGNYTCEGVVVDRARMTNDAAYYHLCHSQDVVSRNLGKPVIRGEAGLDFVGAQEPNPDLQNDTEGVWFHNYLWSTLDPGAMYEIYFYPQDFYRQGIYDHRPEFNRVRGFQSGLQLAAGGWQDWAGTVDNSNLRVVGQKNPAEKGLYLWVQNKNHTWRNVVDGVNIAPQSGTITVSGFNPNESFTIEEWDTWTGQAAGTRTETVNSNGELVLSVSNLTTDLAFRVLPQGGAGPTPTPGPIPGDVNGDGRVSLGDALLILSAWLEGNREEDVNGDGRVNGVDLGHVIKNWGR